MATNKNGATLTASGPGAVKTPTVVEISTVTEIKKLTPTGESYQLNNATRGTVE